MVQNNGPVVTINVDHGLWETSGVDAQWAIGHESLHSIGFTDQIGENGSRAYKYGLPRHRKAFKSLTGTPQALSNPDHIMDEVY